MLPITWYDVYTVSAVKYTKEMLEEAVKVSLSFAETLRTLGISPLSGGMQYHLTRRIRAHGIDTSHFVGKSHQKGKISTRRLSAKQLLVNNPDAHYRETATRLRRCLLEVGVPHICGECGRKPLWRKRPLLLEIDHINGDWRDNREINLRFLCPNCHSQTETYGNKRE